MMNLLQFDDLNEHEHATDYSYDEHCYDVVNGDCVDDLKLVHVCNEEFLVGAHFEPTVTFVLLQLKKNYRKIV